MYASVAEAHHTSRMHTSFERSKFVCTRTQHVERLSVRLAVVEGMDLNPSLHASSNLLYLFNKRWAPG